MRHTFTKNIDEVLTDFFDKNANRIFKESYLIQYINIKTKSAERNSKSRGSFGNLYSIYVLLEDYLNNGFDAKDGYEKYEGAIFSNLFKRQRELPFGAKLQNHALNHRMNEEFRKYFPNCEQIPILRDPATNRYWFNSNLIKIQIDDAIFDIARAIIEIINKYIETKKDAFDKFIAMCETLKGIKEEKEETVKEFVMGLLLPNVDARIFEIVSFAILKYFYHDQTVFFGYDIENIEELSLKLYKTGRTNANDGGIDFVMKPLGRFFQVTETTDVKKFFLDIDKLEKFPITFVIKSDASIDTLKSKIRVDAKSQYAIDAIVNKYMDCIEEIINIAEIKDRFEKAIADGHINSILDEIIIQSKVEFNYQEEEEEETAKSPKVVSKEKSESAAEDFFDFS